MKVITEERLKKFRDELSAKGQAIGACTIALLMNDCLEEIDTLTVSKLRPISELPLVPDGKYSVSVLVFFENMSYPSIRRIGLDSGFEKDVLKCGLGWIPMPIYKPELTGE